MTCPKKLASKSQFTSLGAVYIAWVVNDDWVDPKNEFTHPASIPPLIVKGYLRSTLRGRRILVKPTSSGIALLRKYTP